MRARRGDAVSLLPVQHIAHSRHSAFTFPPRGIEASGSKQEPHVSHKNKRRDRIPVVVISLRLMDKVDGNKLAWDEVMDK